MSKSPQDIINEYLLKHKKEVYKKKLNDVFSATYSTLHDDTNKKLVTLESLFDLYVEKDMVDKGKFKKFTIFKTHYYRWIKKNFPKQNKTATDEDVKQNSSETPPNEEDLQLPLFDDDGNPLEEPINVNIGNK